MSQRFDLLTFSIGPVHAFIVQARKVADLWTGSDLLSLLMGEAIKEAHSHGGEPLFPAVGAEDPPPQGLPNRLVCRVPAGSSEQVARDMEARVRSTWNRRVRVAVNVLQAKGLLPLEATEAQWRRHTDPVFEVSWSWVSEGDDYAAAARMAASAFEASRLFRPFQQIDERGEKCAICGERMALPDGDRQRVREAWEQLEAESEGEKEQRFFRLDQTRLCLVCATKRLGARERYDKEHGPYFSGFDQFQPEEDTAYFALVAMDGDRMGDVLGGSAVEVAPGRMLDFHREVSRALSGFSSSLRAQRPWQLALGVLGEGEASFELLGKTPQLIYAGGEDVLVLCDPRDALGIARAIRRRYLEALAPVRKLLARPEDFDGVFTISAGILFAHSKYPAGLAFRDVQQLLDRKAKGEAGRNAVALRLDKRGGVPVEVAFRWDQAEPGEPTWVERFERLTAKLVQGDLSSRLTYNLRREELVLRQVFDDDQKRWLPWLEDRLSRSEVSADDAKTLAPLLAPFLIHGHAAALRIARFLGREVPSLRAHQKDEEKGDAA